MKNKIIKSIYILMSILLVLPSTIYLIKNKTVFGFDLYYNFFINENFNKTVSTIIYLALFIVSNVVYVKIIKTKDIFESIKSILKYVAIIGGIFVVMLPWTCSDIFYYMGVGELDSVYNENPYYVSMEEYYNENADAENINDEIFLQGASNYWASTTVVYGPIAQMLFKLCALVSFKNINLCILVFKLLNLTIHLFNTYIIYKISNKKEFSILYGLNPFILLEFIANVHNDIIVIFFVLLSLFFLIKKKNIVGSVICLAFATGIKYSTVLMLPLIILYHFRDEHNIWKKILHCIKYGIFFLLLFALEYLPYVEDFNVFLAMLPQTDRYSKSIYSALTLINWDLMYNIKTIFTCIFIVVYIKYSFDFLFDKSDISVMLRKYNIIVILSLLLLTNCHQWYLGWLFATIIWQKTNMIKSIIGLTAITEIANSIYMFKEEYYIYDIYFQGIIIFLFIVLQISILIGNRNIMRKNNV